VRNGGCVAHVCLGPIDLFDAIERLRGNDAVTAGA
jgi:hypothetical protein